MDYSSGINVSVPPSGPGCVECTAEGSWWFHLRRCAECGHIGCCDSSPNRHATAHEAATGHPVIRSYEPGENWFWITGAVRFSRVLRWRRRSPTR